MDFHARVETLFECHLQQVRRQVNRLFFWLMIGQWILGILIAVFYSPYSWAGRIRSVHVHVYTAVFLGGLISSFPVVLIRLKPYAKVTGYVVAGAQGLWSALLIHLTGGRIETHFHIFGSFLFIALYRDWGILGLWNVVVTGDHLLRCAFWPDSIFGLPHPDWWRFFEHGFWMNVTAIVFAASPLSGTNDLHEIAVRQAEAEEHVSRLETRDKENTLLNEELRRQIADRSQHFADALARIGVVPEQIVELRPDDEIQGRYRVVRSLGAGAMGKVYEVERLKDGGRLALKMLTAATTGTALARLAREAQIAAMISHENLVAIADVDVSEKGTLYIVMELVDGASLSQWTARYGDLSFTLPVLRQIARGLSALHDRGVVHRDLKPANVLLTRKSIAKIADFGIARLGVNTMASEPASPTTSTLDGRREVALPKTMAGSGPALTGTGEIMGTPLYMAPELAHGAEAASPCSDIWSFGVMAYELSTGRRPFTTTSGLDALAGHAPALSQSLAESAVPEWLAALISQCLAINPALRPTATALSKALESGYLHTGSR